MSLQRASNNGPPSRLDWWLGNRPPKYPVSELQDPDKQEEGSKKRELE